MQTRTDMERGAVTEKDSVLRHAAEDSNRIGIVWYSLLGMLLTITSLGTIFWVMYGIDYAGSTHWTGQREYYIYVFDKVYMHHLFQSRKVGVILGACAAGVWALGVAVYFLRKWTGLGKLKMLSDSLNEMIQLPERGLMSAFRHVVWFFNISVMLTLATDAGTNDFWQLLTICMIEAAATVTALSLKKRAFKSGKVVPEDQTTLVSRAGQTGEEGEKIAPLQEGVRAYFMVAFVWVVPQIVLVMNHFRVFEAATADWRMLTSIVMAWSLFTAIFKSTIVLLIAIGMGPIDSWYHDKGGDGPSKLGDDQLKKMVDQNVQGEGRAAWAAASKVTESTMFVKIIAFMAIFAFLGTVAIAGAGESSDNRLNRFRTRLTLHSHVGSASVRVDGVVVENFNFEEHVYSLHVMWMLVASALFMAIMWAMHAWPKLGGNCLSITVYKTIMRTPDLARHAVLGVSSGIVSAVVMAQAGYDDPMTMFAVAVMGCSGLMLLSLVRVRFHQARQFWMFSSFMAMFPVVIILVALVMRPGDKSTARLIQVIVGMCLVFFERLFVVISTFPGDFEGQFWVLGRWIMFAWANIAVIVDIHFVTLFGLLSTFQE